MSGFCSCFLTQNFDFVLQYLSLYLRMKFHAGNLVAEKGGKVHISGATNILLPCPLFPYLHAYRQTDRWKIIALTQLTLESFPSFCSIIFSLPTSRQLAVNPQHTCFHSGPKYFTTAFLQQTSTGLQPFSIKMQEPFSDANPINATLKIWA